MEDEVDPDVLNEHYEEEEKRFQEMNKTAAKTAEALAPKPAPIEFKDLVDMLREEVQAEEAFVQVLFDKI
jgi:hypothetical protein